MNSLQQSVIVSYRLAGSIGAQMALGVDEAAARKHAAGQAAPIIWQYGHLVLCSDLVLDLLGQARSQDEALYYKLFGNGTVYETGRDYPQFEALVEQYKAVHSLVEAAFAIADEERLAAPMPLERLRGRFPLVGDAVVFLMTGHEQYHLALVGGWRRQLGLTPR